MKKLYLLLFCLPSLLLANAYANSELTSANDVDFLHYKAHLEPDFDTKTISGKVNIRFTPQKQNLEQLVFSIPNIDIKSITSFNKPLSFSIDHKRLTINFTQALTLKEEHSITVAYQATPAKGVKFFDDHLFTVYHTKAWLVSHSDIADKASLNLFLTHDENLTSIGNGLLIKQSQPQKGEVTSQWLQASEMPIYTFGFALGEFNQSSDLIKNKKIHYYFRKQPHSSLTKNAIQDAFSDVPDMVSFFENKAGFPLPQNDYSYAIVNGYMAQEASGFSLVGEKFVHTVLEDKHENWFIAHELAHEWWGNSITCKSWSHFWLNEGLVQFLVAAYKQHLFGDDAYKNEINIAVKRVNKAMTQNRLSPVAFTHDIEENTINRTMVYSKGALVFHLLRTQLGDELFWQALKAYSLQYRGQSVTTENLQSTFERVSHQDLDAFFKKWVYGNDIPEIVF